MNNNDSTGSGGESTEKSGEGMAEVGGGLEGGQEVVGEFVEWVWWWDGKWREREVMEMDVGDGFRVPALNPELGLPVVGGRADKVDWKSPGREKA